MDFIFCNYGEFCDKNALKSLCYIGPQIELV